MACFFSGRRAGCARYNGGRAWAPVMCPVFSAAYQQQCAPFLSQLIGVFLRIPLVATWLETEAGDLRLERRPRCRGTPRGRTRRRAGRSRLRAASTRAQGWPRSQLGGGAAAGTVASLRGKGRGDGERRREDLRRHERTVTCVRVKQRCALQVVCGKPTVFQGGRADLAF